MRFHYRIVKLVVFNLLNHKENRKFKSKKSVSVSTIRVCIFALRFFGSRNVIHLPTTLRKVHSFFFMRHFNIFL